MKKILVILLPLSIFCGGLYFFIPSNPFIGKTISVSTTDINAFKFLVNQKKWIRWWPGSKVASNDSLFVFSGISFQIVKNTYSGVTVFIKDDEIALNSKISYAATDNETVNITWLADTQNNNGLTKRVENYVEAIKLNKSMFIILQHLKAFMENDQNVYGLKIGISHVKDSVMVAAKTIRSGYPDVPFIYGMVKALKKQYEQQNIKATNYPMLNISKNINNNYDITVAIPVDKTPGRLNKNTFVNKMVVGGNIMVTEVKGGPYIINNAFLQLKNYSRDHHLTAPAMPFELLVTDRSVERDTSKWVTKIYYPIF